MKAFVATLVATSILSGFAFTDTADARTNKARKKYAAHKRYYAPRNTEADSWSQNTTQVQYDLNKLPFGSKLWWEQYLRTSGGGQGGDGGSGGGGR
jgi:hypothetical protein